MDNDYQNFVERMGSFGDIMDVSDDSEILQSNTRIVTRNRGALINKDDELIHYGKLGMHWGHKNHVNAKWTSSDGSSHTPFKVNVNMVGKAAKTGQDLASLGQTVSKGKFSKKSLAEAKNLNDDDLKRLTTRLNLENNYMNAQMQQSGKGKVENILSTAGSALAVASSAAVLYKAVRKFK